MTKINNRGDPQKPARKAVDSVDIQVTTCCTEGKFAE
jgi:hypothetical protein